MNKIYKLAIMVIAVFALSSCYNHFDDPAPTKPWTEADFPDQKLITIKQLKQMFIDKYGTGASSLAQTLPITEDLMIAGKVISSDQAGNVYKSIYLYDESCESAIEVKVMVSNWVLYHPGQTVYIKLNGLCVGSYRYMLSVGTMPSAADIADGYANNNIQTKPDIDAHIFIGALGQLTAADTLVITPSNYSTALTDDALGRLVRFEGVTYKTGTFDGDKYPQYLEVTYPNGQTTGVYTNQYELPDGKPFTTFAYNYDDERYYGSSWFSYNAGSPTYTGNYIVRVSGYSNFALVQLPTPNTTGDITAIYTKYSSRSGGFVKYQLLLNSDAGVVF